MLSKKITWEMEEKELFVRVGEKIRELRNVKSVSQLELAERCDFEKSNMSRIEAGRTNLTLRSLNKISRALGVTVAELVDVEQL